MAKKRLISQLNFFFLIGSLMLGCQDSDPRSKVDQISDELDRVISDAKERIGQIAPSKEKVKESTTGEVEKLFTIEYKIVEVEKELPTADLERKLQELGLERWECFKIDKTETNLRLFLKRPAKTYLRYIPRFF